MTDATKIDPNNPAVKAAIAVHERLRDVAKEMIQAGTEPGIIMHAMITTGTDGLLQTHGREHAMRALLECYGPIRAAVIDDHQRPAPARN